MVQERIGRYEIVEEIASGGQATVYRARDTNLGRIVALKIMHPHLARDAQFVERFLREARIQATFTHQNVVTIFEIGEEDGRHFIAMEHLPSTLHMLLQERRTLPITEALRITMEVARGLQAAQGRGIVHRDLKPQNILMNEEGTPKVSDFGVARAAEMGTMTATGMVLGTPQYMSPEQARGERVDGRSDLYSLGILLFEMVSGRTPLEGKTPQEILRYHLVDSDVLLDALPGLNLPPSVDKVLRLLLAKDRRPLPDGARDRG